MLDARLWNFTQPAKITGAVVIIGRDIVGDAKRLREANRGPLVLLLPRPPEVSELVRLPKQDCLFVCESGDSLSEEFVRAAEQGIFYANGATGAIQALRSHDLCSLDLLVDEDAAIAKFEAELQRQAQAHRSDDDAGNGMSSRLVFLLDQAGELSKAGKHLSAERAYLLAAPLDAKSAAVHNNLGSNYIRWGRPRAAEQCYRRCLQHHPHEHRAHKNLGDVLLQLNRMDEAKQSYETALAIDAAYAAAWYGLGLTQIQREDYSAAETSLRQAVYYDPADARAFVNLGAALAFQDRWQQALEAHEEAKLLAPDMAGLDQQLAYIRTRLAG